MSTKAQEVLELAMQLTPDERFDLAETLRISLMESDESEVEASWAAEIARRGAEIDAGAKLVPWAEIKADLLARVKK